MPPIPWGRASVGLASLASLARPCTGVWQYNPEQKIESARLMGDMNHYAYYFTDLMVGKPTPQRVSVIIDTGSRMSGFPCASCDHCGEHLDPAFDISSSDTASWSSCSEGCAEECVGNRCPYRETYAEGSSVEGFWFTDFMELGDSFSKNPAVLAKMGCHDMEDKLFFTQRANGIMGLAPPMGSHPTILQEMLHDRQHIDALVFAICLASTGGRMTLGGFNSSYHVSKSDKDPLQWVAMRVREYYFVSLEGLSLIDGRDTIRIPGGAAAFGPTIVDSGTTYTYLQDGMFSALTTRLDYYCAEHDGCGADKESDRCWRLRDAAGGPADFPPLAVRFSEGVSVDWMPRSYLQRQVGDDALWCRAFEMSNNLKQTVLGMSFMLHKDFIFDIARGRLGIADAQCPEYVEQPPEGDGARVLEQRQGRQAPQLVQPRLGAPMR